MLNLLFVFFEEYLNSFRKYYLNYTIITTSLKTGPSEHINLVYESLQEA